MADQISKALAIVPHPDDAEFGCGGTVARWTAEGIKVVYVLCTNGDKGTSDLEMTPQKLAVAREKEQLAAARALGVEEVVFLRHPDGELEDTKEFRGEIVKEIRKHRPDVVLAPDPWRRTAYFHRDHRIAGQVALDAVYPYARDHLHYQEHMAQGLKPHKVAYIYLWGSEEPDTFIDITQTIDKKLQSLGCHKSQSFLNPGSGFEERVREWAKNMGRPGNCRYAEGFRRIELRR